MCENDLKQGEILEDINGQKTIIPSLWQYDLANKHEEVQEEVHKEVEVVITADMPTGKQEQLDVESEPTIREIRHCDPKTKIGDLVNSQKEKTVNVHLSADEARRLSEFLGGMKNK